MLLKVTAVFKTQKIIERHEFKAEQSHTVFVNLC